VVLQKELTAEPWSLVQTSIETFGGELVQEGGKRGAPRESDFVDYV